MNTACRRVLTVLFLLTPLVVVAQPSLYVTPDVPTDLDATTYLPWEIVRGDVGSHASELLLPQGTAVDALHRMDGGDWLFSVAVPTTLDGATYRPADIVRLDGTTYSTYFSGSAAGVPPGSGVDALFLNDTGDLVLSFDVPTTIGPTTYEPADLVLVSGGAFVLYLDASSGSMPIPPASNLIGADFRDDAAIATFDVPTTIGSDTYLPGELFAWDGDTVEPYAVDPSWPTSSRVNALSFLPPPGEAASILLSKAGPGALTISWSPSCLAGAEGYAIYQGQIGDWYSHVPIGCFDDEDDLTETFPMPGGGPYYLVVPYNENDEGSHGVDSAGQPRPRVAEVCVATQVTATCPVE